MSERGSRNRLYYAVANGYKKGVFNSWYSRNIFRPECENQVKGFSNARFRKFSSRAEAEEFVRQGSRVRCDGSIASSSSRTIQKSERPSSHEFKAAGHKATYKNYPTMSRECNQTSRNTERVYVDGSCSNNGYSNSKGGIGVFWGDNDPRNVSEKVYSRNGPITNQKTELMAALKVLDTTPSHKDITICSDSAYLVEGMNNWSKKWVESDWKIPIANQDLFRDLHNRIENRAGRVFLKHVKGHSNIYENEQADRLAKLGRDS